MVPKVYEIRLWSKTGGQWHKSYDKVRQYLSCLNKISTSYNRHFSVIARSKRAFEEINYKILEDLKDGDAFVDKCNSQLLKIKSPNVVMVFSNAMPEDYKMPVGRWRVFNIVTDERRMNDPSRTHSFVHEKIGQKDRLW